VETILQKAGDSHESLLRQVSDRLNVFAPRAALLPRGEEARAPRA